MENRLQEIQKSIFNLFKDHDFYVNIALFDINDSIFFAKNYFPEIKDYFTIALEYETFQKDGVKSPYIKNALEKGEYIVKKSEIEPSLYSSINLFIYNLFEKSNCNILYYFRIGTLDQKIGLITILSATKLNNRLKNRIKTTTHQRLLIPFLDISRSIYKEEKERAITYASKAAISQVMARNMSHNIGSHVLSKLITIHQLMGILQPENKWQCQTDKEFEFKNKVLIEELHKIIEQFKDACSKKVDCKAIEDCFYSINKTLTKFEFQTFSNYTYLERFFSYLKARMDYLADVTTNTPVIENIKGIYNDIVKLFINNRVLNDRISGIDDFKYEIIVCKPPLNKDEHCVNHTTERCRNTVNVIDSSKDLPLSIPNDILGSHAFYTILENIIRNTAKHGNTPQEQNTEFKIKIEEAGIHKVYNTDSLYNEESKELDWNEFYAISIFDNCDLSSDTLVDPGDYIVDDVIKVDKYKERKICEFQEDGRKKIKLKKINKLVIDQNHILNKSILENNQLRHGGWGLIEMEASAAYLRKIDVELIDSDKYQITDLHGKNPVTLEGELAIFQAYAEQEKYLGYRFFVRKPQEILIIADDDDLNLTEKQKKEKNKKKLFAYFKNAGVWIYSKKEFLDFYRDKKQKVFPHKLVVVVSDTNNEIKGKIEENKACFSRRVLTLSEKLDLTDEHTLDKFKLEIWKKYYINEGIKFYKEPSDKFKELKDFVPVKESNDNCLSAIIENHAEDYCEKAFGKQGGTYSTYNYIEIMTSATNHFFADIYKIGASVKDSIQYFQQWASASIPILVLDERMQDFTFKNKHSIKSKKDCKPNNICYHKQGGIPYDVVFTNTNVFIPDTITKCNLNAQNFHTITSESDSKSEYSRIIETFQNFLFKHQSEKHFFVVIHLGIIEKLINAHKTLNKDSKFNKDNAESIKEFIISILLKNKITSTDLTNYYDNIIITSGRGTPQNIPKGIRYLNFSVISQYMITLRNKFAFSEALFSSRKTN